MGRHSQTKSAVIKEKIVLGTQAGKNQGEVAAELAVSREHVNRTLAELRDRFKDRSPEAFSEYVQRQIELLTKAIEEVWEGKLPPEAANSIRGLMDSIARLTGSNAPTKHITARVDAERITQGFYAEFARRTIKKFKHQASWQRLWDWIEAQPSDYEEEDRLLLEAHDENV